VGIDVEVGEADIVVFEGFVEPAEGLVFFPEGTVEQGDVVRRNIAFACDRLEFGENGACSACWPAAA
jgi:hypothetical protein